MSDFQIGVAGAFIIVFSVCALLFTIYLLYVCYLKKCKGYQYENGVPDVAILRPSPLGGVGVKHFSAAAFRVSHIGTSSSDRNSLLQPTRPHTFPLSGPPRSAPIPIPEIRIHRV